MKLKNELNKRVSEVELVYKRSLEAEKRKISGVGDAVDIFREVFTEDKIETREFGYAVYLNQSNEVLALTKIGEGTLSSTQFCTRTLLVTALKLHAAAIILAHNHPSGNLKFSTQDISLTEKINELCKTLGITLMDHIVITRELYSSMMEEGMM